ncbi:hypothetical protein [Flavobacterium proteolyticum]|uniref:Lipoprotein n=1 Tax=Flavobacterium proteolyticum TaxID=2911683 RepID=A0ABR9WTR3_9FLAO|nr:hypothetical protein [Flavobacterium proteolyticum]MBE9577041.1 hypothetical protein [Flavobacterium proteolyticum]
MKKNTLAIISILVIIGSIVTFKLFFQDNDDIKSALSTKDYLKLENCIEKLFDEDKINGRLKYFREVAPGFNEGFFEYYQYIYKNGKKTSSLEGFQIKLITSENEIIYYEFNEEKNKKVKSSWSDSYEWEPYYVLIEKFQNDKEFENLKTSFKNNFQAELNEKELFLTNITFGNGCGAAAMYSKERMQLNEFVDKKDKKSILKWLQSTNTEKQMFAVEGFLKLMKSGTKFSQQELTLLNYITNKKGTVRVCYGCSYRVEEINIVLKILKEQLE